MTKKRAGEGEGKRNGNDRKRRGLKCDIRINIKEGKRVEKER